MATGDFVVDKGHENSIDLELKDFNGTDFKFGQGAHLLVNKNLKHDTYDDNAVNNIANFLNKKIDDEIERVENLGDYAGSVNTKADLPTTVNAKGITMLNGRSVNLSINDFVTVKQDIDHDGLATRYVVRNISGTNGNRTVEWVYDITYGTDITGKMDLLTSKNDAGKIVVSKNDGNVEVSNLTINNVIEGINKRISCRIDGAFAKSGNDNSPLAIGDTVHVTLRHTHNEEGNICNQLKESETIIFDQKGVAVVVDNISPIDIGGNFVVTSTVVSTSGFDDVSASGNFIRTKGASGAPTWTPIEGIKLDTGDFVKRSGDFMHDDGGYGTLVFSRVNRGPDNQPILGTDGNKRYDPKFVIDGGGHKIISFDHATNAWDKSASIEFNSGGKAPDPASNEPGFPGSLALRSDRIVLCSNQGVQIGTSEYWNDNNYLHLDYQHINFKTGGSGINFDGSGGKINLGNDSSNGSGGINLNGSGNTINFSGVGSNKGGNAINFEGNGNAVRFRGQGDSISFYQGGAANTQWIYFNQGAFTDGGYTAQENDKRFGVLNNNLVRQYYDGNSWVTIDDDDSNKQKTEWTVISLAS